VRQHGKRQHGKRQNGTEAWQVGRKLEGNGLWESSRMMLPEHKESLVQRLGRLGRRSRPMLAEEERERLFRLLAEAAASGQAVAVRVFSDGDIRELAAVTVLRLDPLLRRVRLRCGEEEEWVGADEIVDVIG
jgi:ATP-dependent helicase YprA (DUF1998 family)